MDPPRPIDQFTLSLLTENKSANEILNKHNKKYILLNISDHESRCHNLIYDSKENIFCNVTFLNLWDVWLKIAIPWLQVKCIFYLPSKKMKFHDRTYFSTIIQFFVVVVNFLFWNVRKNSFYLKSPSLAVKVFWGQTYKHTHSEQLYIYFFFYK